MLVNEFLIKKLERFACAFIGIFLRQIQDRLLEKSSAVITKFTWRIY